jgi:hypothetical protein
MSAQPNQPEHSRAKLNQGRLNFFKNEFKLCSTFLDLADTRIKMGRLKSARTAIAKAETSYKTVSRFLSDPKHISNLTPDQLQGFRTELKRLRERLDGFQKGKR